MVERHIEGRGIQNPLVLEAMRKVERHHFVHPSLMQQAYNDHPLSIGHGQTISQPYIVAAMTELLDPQPDHVVLEVGAGSGYQAAVLAELVKHVYTIEIVDPLAQECAERMRALGYDNVTVRSGDGYHGWPQHAPFDAIIVTAAPESVPQPLIDQLKPNGRMVIPVGPMGRTQRLILLERRGDTLHERFVMPVVFVPFTRSEPGE